jgi:hypothetical protein
MMKIRLREFLTPRRRYELNESMWLVKYGRPKIGRILHFSVPVVLRVAKGGVESGILILKCGIIVASAFSLTGHKVVLFVQWRGMPKSWEVSFVDKMKLVESKGIPFPEVLRAYLPTIMGEAPADVLLKWVGRRTRQQPKPFAKAVSKMFGKSAKRIITGLENLADPDKMLESHLPVEAPYQSLVDAISAADAATS